MIDHNIKPKQDLLTRVSSQPSTTFAVKRRPPIQDYNEYLNKKVRHYTRIFDFRELLLMIRVTLCPKENPAKH